MDSKKQSDARADDRTFLWSVVAACTAQVIVAGYAMSLGRRAQETFDLVVAENLAHGSLMVGYVEVLCVEGTCFLALVGIARCITIRPPIRSKRGMIAAYAAMMLASLLRLYIPVFFIKHVSL